MMWRFLLLICLIFQGLAGPVSAVTLQLDYSFDAANGNFFGQTPQAKAAVDAAAADLGAVLTAQLGAITTDVFVGKSGSTTATFNWSVNFTNPSTGATVTLQSFALPANTIRIYVGMQKLDPKASELGEGGPGGAGFSLNGAGLPQDWINAIKNGQNLSNATMSRGGGPVIGTLGGSSLLGGVSAAYSLNYGPIVGNVWFNKDTNKDGKVDDAATLAGFWHYDHTTPVPAGKNDFYSVALHELIHSLGFGQSATWRAEHAGTTWVGTRAKALNGNSGAQLVAGDNVHITTSFLSTRLSDGQPQEAAMDPSLTTGSRKALTVMDIAFLADIGYVAPIVPVPVTASAQVVSNLQVFIQGSVILKGNTTAVTVEYGPTTQYGFSRTFVLPSSIPDFNEPTPVSLLLDGLEAGTTYHYRIKAAGLDGVAAGADATFTLPSPALGAAVTADAQPVTFSPLTPGALPGSPAEGITLFLPGNSSTQKVAAVTQGGFGSVVIQGANIVYTPGPNYFGEDSFSYTIDFVTPFNVPGVKPPSGPFKATVRVRSSAPAGPHTAAIKGGAVPGAASGTVFKSLGTPAAGPFGGIQQGAGGVQRAIFTSSGMLLFKAGDSPAALGARKIAKFGDPSGQALLAGFKVAAPDVTAKNDAVLIAGLDEGFPRVAAREGLPLPGLPEGITVKSFGSIDGTGPVIFFFATLQGKTVNAKNDGALCAAYADGTVRVLAREGDSVDGKSITVLGSLVGVAGTLADGRWLAGNDLQPALGARLTFSDKSQAIYKIPAAAGAPWIKLAETGTALGLASFGLPGFGPDGAAFRASWKAGEANVTSANDTALFHSQGGMMTMLARESEPAPGADGNPLADLRFKSFSDPVSGAGQTGAFTAVVTGTGVKASNRTGLWSFVAGTKRVRLLARAGDAAPGGGKWAAFPSLAMSDAPGGGALFLATRVVEAGSPLSAKDNLGLWAVGSNGTLQALVQTGQMMQVGNGTKKVASFVALKAAAGSIGAAQGYDNEGRVAVLVTFDDRSEALIISVVP